MVLDFIPSASRFTKYVATISYASVFGGASFYILAYNTDPTIFQVMTLSIVAKILLSIAYFPALRHLRRL